MRGSIVFAMVDSLSMLRITDVYAGQGHTISYTISYTMADVITNQPTLHTSASDRLVHGTVAGDH